MNPEIQQELQLLRNEIDDLRYLLYRKAGGGSADIKANLVAPSSVPATTIPSGSITKTQISYEEVTVSVSAGQTSGTGTATNGSVIIGWRPSGNIDQVVDSIAISSTTITVTLGVAATATNNFVVICLKA